MNLFDEKFIYEQWDNKLLGYNGFLANSIEELQKLVDDENVCPSGMIENTSYDKKDKPFYKVGSINSNTERTYKYAYYDPNYYLKQIFNNGEKIESTPLGKSDWKIDENPTWSDTYEYKYHRLTYGEKCEILFNSFTNSNCEYIHEIREEYEKYKNSHIIDSDINESLILGMIAGIIYQKNNELV